MIYERPCEIGPDSFPGAIEIDPRLAAAGFALTLFSSTCSNSRVKEGKSASKDSVFSFENFV